MAGWAAVVPFLLLIFGLGLADVAVVFSLEADAVTTAIGIALYFALPFVGSILVARAARIMAPALAGQRVSFGRAGRGLRGALPHVFAAAMISTLLTFVLSQLDPVLLARVAPFLVIGPPVLAQVLAIERRPLGEAWRRTRELVTGQALRVFLYLLCMALAVAMFRELLVGLVFQATRGLGDAGLLSALAFTILTGLGLSFMAAAGLVTYLDCRTRTETYALEDLKESDDVATDDEV
ncbi:MAG: hypothetical protein M3174_03500 [Actinomycetota bacterium]|nr:hypothetical protein [Actinomycetota bacterium]